MEQQGDTHKTGSKGHKQNMQVIKQGKWWNWTGDTSGCTRSESIFIKHLQTVDKIWPHAHTHTAKRPCFSGGGLERPCGPATRQRDASLTFHRSLSPPGFSSHFKLRGLRGHAAKRHGRGPHSTPSPQNQNKVSPGEHQGTMTSSRLINPARPSDPAQFP